MAKKKSGFVTGHQPGVGKGDFANMPQQVDMRAYPKARSYRDTDLDDTIDGIDKVIDMSENKSRKYMSNQK